MARENRVRKASLWLLTLGIVFAFAASAQGEKVVPPSPSPAGSLGLPERARQLSNPYVGNPEAILAGKKLFKRHCAECHGEDGTGGRDAPDLRTQEIEEAAPGELFWTIRNGKLKEGMPSWSRLPEERIWQIVSYLQTDE